jgi:hypothetical protein
MACEAYKGFTFNKSTLDLIGTMNKIVAEYLQQGFKLTVRQLYYQLVARDIIPNNIQSYKRAASILNDARLAGMVDWDVIEDRTREFLRRQRWASGEQILDAAANSFHMDMWVTQDTRCFVIIEKEALVGVLEPMCRKWDVPLLAARGYPSGTVLREFALEDIVPVVQAADQHVIIYHCGDHDPSGIDMTRDLKERISLFSSWDIELRRIALNMDQIQQYNPPPNPAKTTDSRFESYVRHYGNESWELDALPPTDLSTLVEDEIRLNIDDGKWEDRAAQVRDIRERISHVAESFK